MKRVLREKKNKAMPINIYTEKFIESLDASDSFATSYRLFLLGMVIAIQFVFCKSDEKLNKLHEMNPHFCKAVEGKRINTIVSAVELYSIVVNNYFLNVPPYKVFSSLLDLNIYREQTRKNIINGVSLANSYTDDEKKQQIKNTLISLLESLNYCIDYYNTIITNENSKRLYLHNDTIEETSKAKVLRPLKKFTSQEIGL